MKSFFVYILIASSFLGFSQNLQIEYNVIFNNFKTVKKQGVLIIDSSNSYYFEFPEFDKKVDDEIIQMPSDLKKVFVDNEKSLIKSVEPLFMVKEKYEVSEEIPSYNYRLTNEIRTISNIKCSKITLNFRGREYFIWYSLEHPYSFGPWKFCKTPGLIIQAGDSQGKVIWTMTRISNQIDSQFPEFVKLDKDNKKIDLKSYVKIKDSIVDSRVKRNTENVQSRLPRGVNMSATYYPGRKGLEQTYEWETEDSEKN